jgi:hypothetical protein
MSGLSTPVPESNSGDSSGSSSRQCNCWAATLRVANLCRPRRDQWQSASRQANISDSSLNSALSKSRCLSQNWEQLNGCASSESHMEVQMLHPIVEMIEWVLQDHESAVDVLSSSFQEFSIPSTFIGSLELDNVEAMIAVQEALSQSVCRLAVMLQDIKEESFGHDRSSSEAEHPLHLKELTTRLFRLLSRIDRLETVQ